MPSEPSPFTTSRPPHLTTALCCQGIPVHCCLPLLEASIVFVSLVYVWPVSATRIIPFITLETVVLTSDEQLYTLQHDLRLLDSSFRAST